MYNLFVQTFHKICYYRVSQQSVYQLGTAHLAQVWVCSSQVEAVKTARLRSKKPKPKQTKNKVVHARVAAIWNMLKSLLKRLCMLQLSQSETCSSPFWNVWTCCNNCVWTRSDIWQNNLRLTGNGRQDPSLNNVAAWLLCNKTSGALG